MLDTVRKLGFLQVDPIASVATPQQLVLWSRLGSYDIAELDRLLWEERKLFESAAFIRPIEDYPLILARMRRKRTGKYAWERRGNEFLQKNAPFRRHVLGELERRGPLLSRELVDTSVRTWESGGWYGNRNVTVMLELLERRGQVAIVGRRGGHRLWDLAERWFPPVEPPPLEEAEALLEEKRWRALGVRRPSIHVPFGLMRANALITERLPGDVPLTRDLLTMLEHGDNTVSNDDAVQTFGLPLAPLDEQLRRAI